ncbi:MAG: DUF1223 domain-containing protein [Proteobacteria bacterium]|nr:DUF1223 domain-containing protein [Pseudomonadota bacterium]
MRLQALLLGLVLLAAAPVAAKTHKTHKPAREPVVVELFTAQGCADCAQANELLAKIADEPGVIALTFPVDYWDYLGWHDTFAKPEFGERQRAYMKAMKLRDVYTPQVVVDGSRQLAGVKPDEVQAAVREAGEGHGRLVAISASRGRAQVGSGKAPVGGAVVWLVRYDPEVREVQVKTGENKGRAIRHAHLVRQLVKLGDWKGSAKAFRMPKASEDGLKSVVIVQAARTGKLVAAKKL